MKYHRPENQNAFRRRSNTGVDHIEDISVEKKPNINKMMMQMQIGQIKVGKLALQEEGG